MQDHQSRWNYVQHSGEVDRNMTTKRYIFLRAAGKIDTVERRRPMRGQCDHGESEWLTTQAYA